MEGKSAQSILDTLLSMKKRRQGDKNKADIEFILNELSPMLYKFIDRDKKRDLGFKYEDGSSNPVDVFKAIYNILNSSKSNYPKLEHDLEFLNRQYNDLNHALEFLEDDDVSMSDMAKELKKNRIQRRSVKNLLELGKTMQDLLSNYPHLLKDSASMCKTVQQIQQTQEARSYYPKELTALEEAFVKAKEKEIVGKR